jgi:O-antigen/teichoic acid export membrane protein
VLGAEAGYGYWSLVALTIITPLIGTVGFWVATGWLPGLPRRRTGIGSMLHFGGLLTLNGIGAYIALNSDKITVGRVWGPEAIGIYGRAYQLISIPIDMMNSGVGEVAFSALSRLQSDPDRLKTYFLKGLSLVVGLTLPFSLAGVLFADDMVTVFLGQKWMDTVQAVQFFSPTIAIFSVISPLTWLLFSMGMAKRAFKMTLVYGPLMITGYLIALPFGYNGVAFAYSTAMTLWLIPHIIWCTRGTPISLREVLTAASGPFASGVLAAVVAAGVRIICGQTVSPLLRLVLEGGALFLTYFGVLVFAGGQRALYLDLLGGLKGQPSAEAA